MTGRLKKFAMHKTGGMKNTFEQMGFCVAAVFTLALARKMFHPSHFPFVFSPYFRTVCRLFGNVLPEKIYSSLLSIRQI